MTRRISWGRPLIGYTAVAATLPYLILKVAWLSGSTVGFNDLAMAHDSALYSANLVTALLDLVALLLALTFTHRFGRRAPAWLILLPIWVGTGLLAPIVAAVPPQVLLAPASGSPVDHPIQSWVYGMVYTGFVCEGVALLVAFLLYARARWPEVFRVRLADWSAGPTQPLQKTVAIGVAVLAVLAAAAHFAWAAGASLGQSADVLDTRNAGAAVVDTAYGLFALAGAAGLLMMVYRRPARVRLQVPLVLAWAGCASLFAWGAFDTAIVVSVNVLSGGGAGAVPNLVGLVKMVAGLLAGMVGAVALTDRPSSRDTGRGGAAGADAPIDVPVEGSAGRPCPVPVESATIV